MTKVKTLQVVKKGMIYAVLVLFSMFFLFPFAFMFFKSVMGNLESAGSPYVRFLPEGAWHFSNYARVFDSSFLRYFRNTLIVIAFNIVGVPLAACFVAFGFARGKFKTKNFWFAVVLGTIMLPGVVTQVPVYIMFKKFGLTGTLAPLIIPNFFGGGALNIFLARQFIRGISKEIDEAARIDGASRLRIFFGIIFPLLKPIIIYIVINTFISCWRDFDSALVFIGDTRASRQWQTLALGIYYKFLIRGTEDVYPNMQMATGVIMVLPVAALFLVFQRRLIEGVVMTGIKG
ncbi:carbohydrate ABC transporter permease [Pumilibacter intestinalis]|jgi:multiple sugar transport system permease protein|uniref:carbohydrate ABC transporter permease n=1 Tax=Pumilibacter intestinalis TaxID=2941511 RepID=UPI002040E4EB|nr:carbohydrate ABC transporter permease [Pumilibacter intestinalis]